MQALGDGPASPQYMERTDALRAKIVERKRLTPQEQQEQQQQEPQQGTGAPHLSASPTPAAAPQTPAAARRAAAALLANADGPASSDEEVEIAVRVDDLPSETEDEAEGLPPLRHRRSSSEERRSNAVQLSDTHSDARSGMTDSTGALLRTTTQVTMNRATEESLANEIDRIATMQRKRDRCPGITSKRVIPSICIGFGLLMISFQPVRFKRPSVSDCLNAIVLGLIGGLHVGLIR